jgi:hypothetical protein
MVVCPLVDSSYTLVTTIVTPTRINLIINNGSDVDLTSTATLTYSANAGGHKLVIPASALSAVTDTAKYEICIRGSGFNNYNLDGLIRLPQSTYATAASISALNNVSTAQVLTQVQSALNSYDAPTKTELDNSVAPLATAASISALNNISQAQVLTQVQSALNSYDAPTKTEMDSGLALLATAANLSTANTNISAIKAKTDNLPSSVPSAAQIVAAFDADVIEGTLTRIQKERIEFAALAGTDDRSGATKYLKSLDGTKTRIAYTDSSIRRTIVSLDGS